MLDYLRKKLRTKNQFQLLLLSYVIITLLSVALNMVSHTYAASITKEEYQRANQNAVSQVRLVYENYFSSFENNGYALINSTAVTQLIYQNSAAADNALFKSIMLDLAHLPASDQAYIKNSILVFRNQDICLDATGKYTKSIAFRAFFQDSYANQEAWINDIFSRVPPGYQIIPDKNELWLIHYNLTSSKTPTAALIMQIDLEAFSRYLQNAAQKGSGSFYIVNEANEVICSSQESASAGMEFTIPRAQDYLILKDNGGNSVRTYVYAMPVSVFSAKMNRLHMFYLVDLLICLLLCFLLSLYFSRTFYKPLWTLVQRLGKDKAPAASEFSFIHAQLDRFMQDKRQMEQKLAQNATELHNSLMTQLLTGEISIQPDNVEFFLENRIPLDGNFYSVCVFNVTDPGLASGESHADSADTAHFLIINVFTELMDNAKTAYTTIDGLLVCLLSFDKPCTSAFVKSRLVSTHDFLRQNMQLEFLCSTGDCTADPSALPALYDQGMETVLQQENAAEEPVLVFHQDTVRTIYEYTAAQQSALLNFLHAGEREKAVDLVEGVFHKNIKVLKMQNQMLRILFFEVTGTVLKSVSDTAQSQLLETEGLLNFRLSTLSQIYQSIDSLCALIGRICAYNTQNKRSFDDSRKDKIQAYIRDNCTDPNLNVSMVAEVFGVSLSYISSIFKEHTGEGMASFIMRCRIEKAKALLENYDKTITQIAFESGFTNANIFIRSFKKQEGITPGQYRNGNTD